MVSFLLQNPLVLLRYFHYACNHNTNNFHIQQIVANFLKNVFPKVSQENQAGLLSAFSNCTLISSSKVYCTLYFVYRFHKYFHSNSIARNIPMSLPKLKSCSAMASTIFESHFHRAKKNFHKNICGICNINMVINIYVINRYKFILYCAFRKHLAVLTIS